MCESTGFFQQNFHHDHELVVAKQVKRESMLQGFFSNKETPCGIGSIDAHTKGARKAVQDAIELTKAKIINDAGCGDRRYWDWRGLDVIGYDWIEWCPDIEVLDITKEKMRSADLTICRFVFIHLRPKQVLSALSLMDTQYLLATRSYDPPDLRDVEMDQRPVNLGLAPYLLQEIESWKDYHSELVLYENPNRHRSFQQN